MANRIFVTGGSGFVGSHVIEELVSRNYEVNALSRSKPVVVRHSANVSPRLFAFSITDVSLVAGIYGSVAVGGAPADLTGNGQIDVTDVSLVAGNYGSAGPTTW